MDPVNMSLILPEVKRHSLSLSHAEGLAYAAWVAQSSSCCTAPFLFNRPVFQVSRDVLSLKKNQPPPVPRAEASGSGPQGLSLCYTAPCFSPSSLTV